MRGVQVEVAFTEDRSSWQFVVESHDNKELSAQDIIDALSDFLLSEGELDPYGYVDPTMFDA